LAPALPVAAGRRDATDEPNYVSAILDKLQVADRAEARLVALAAGIGSGNTPK
jgi:hypothetical protein